MNENSTYRENTKETRFPLSLFFTLFGILLLMSGIHVGLVVLMNDLNWNKVIQSIVPIIYWASVAFGLTIYTRFRIRKVYDEPMKVLAKATAKVADGDFSVYIPPFHTEDRYDYLDKMLLDFDKMVAELGSIETLKTDFFSNVSHEIKTPIAVIQNSAELLKTENLTESERKQYIEIIDGTSHKLSELITNLLKLNKLEKQTIQPKPEAYDLCEQLANCALGFEMQWEKKNINFDAELEDSTIVFADEALMDLVWNNLISNAIKFTEKGGTVSLKQYSADGKITVKVTDTGCGMNKETLSHIFEKFYQGDSSHSTEGNGLGLALALRILQLHEFTISAESEVGKGSSFTVTIPLKGEGYADE